ncbi:hypothetical protein THICB3560282 [Thiomonas sp. CB3]|jgi:hypothetical protein|nr:hypothetical protein THICB3560282 [Thiomonas sp. CB3]
MNKLNDCGVLALSYVDEDTDCVVDEIIFSPKNRHMIAEIIDSDVIYNYQSYELSQEESELIVSANNLSSPPKYSFGRLSLKNRNNILTYMTHSGRELMLMLSGEKPLAVFSDSLIDFSDNYSKKEKLFDHYVSKGVFLKSAAVINKGEVGDIRFILYANPDEAWRMKSYILLQKTHVKCGWNDCLERMEGALLGYSDAQNDEWLENRKKNPPAIISMLLR